MPVSCLSIRSLPHVNKVLNDDEKEGVSKKRTFFFVQKGRIAHCGTPFFFIVSKMEFVSSCERPIAGMGSGFRLVAILCRNAHCCRRKRPNSKEPAPKP